nr:aa3-type cytochrome c oxidase subunit IV [Rubellimicrobium aerolatum]
MDITAQEATFAGFMRFATRMAAIIVVLLVLLALVNG